MSTKYNWCYENSIHTKDQYHQVTGAVEHKYSAFRTNRSLSNFIDTVFQSNDMNFYHHLDPDLQYHYLFHSIRKKKRFFKASKKPPADEDFALIQAYYKYSNKKTQEALEVLSPEQIELIKKKMEKGG